MNKIFVHSQVVAPAPPVWFYEQLENIIHNEENKEEQKLLSHEQTRVPTHVYRRDSAYANRILIHASGSIRTATNDTIFLDEKAVHWVKDNITLHATDLRYCNTEAGLPCLGAHVDLTRNFTMIYLIKSGGDDHCTVFYREKEQQQLERSPGTYVNDYNKLEEIMRVVIPLNQWTVINSKILHSVENISEGRKCLQISLDNLAPDLRLHNAFYLDT